MSAAHKDSVTLTVAGGAGAAPATYTGSAGLRLDSIHYAVGSTPYTSTPLVTVTDEDTSEVLVNAVDISGGARVFRPRLPTHSTAGAANSGDFSAPTVSGRLSFTLTGAGANGQFGTFTVIYGGSK